METTSAVKRSRRRLREEEAGACPTFQDVPQRLGLSKVDALAIATLLVAVRVGSVASHFGVAAVEDQRRLRRRHCCRLVAGHFVLRRWRRRRRRRRSGGALLLLEAALALHALGDAPRLRRLANLERLHTVIVALQIFVEAESSGMCSHQFSVHRFHLFQTPIYYYYTKRCN